MRLFEILTLGILFFTLAAGSWPGSKQSFRTRAIKDFLSGYLPGIAFGFILIHLVIEGYRWQMVPGYALTVLLLVLRLKKIRPGQHPGTTDTVSKKRTWIGIIAVAAGWMVLVIATALPIVMPVFHLPRPGGPYAVGSVTWGLKDFQRNETYSPHPGNKRQLMVQVWYPAEANPCARPMAYWKDAPVFSPLMTELFGLTALPFLFDHLALVQTNTCPDLPLAKENTAYPVIIFSHGYTGVVSQNSIQMEELASHGFIVVSIAHTYEALASVYPDGMVVPYSKKRITAFYNESEKLDPLFRQIDSTTAPAQKAELLHQLIDKSAIANQGLLVWVKDICFVMDELERINAGDSRFSGRLDLSRIGVCGMSYGGAAAGQACLHDSRCKAGINMDGLQYGRGFSGDAVLNRPFMVMYNESSQGINDFMLAHVTGPAYRVTVSGTAHYNFTDFSLISPLFRLMGLIGDIDGQRMAGILNAYTLSFFDQYLNDTKSQLLEGPSPDYPEVSIEIIPQRDKNDSPVLSDNRL